MIALSKKILIAYFVLLLIFFVSLVLTSLIPSSLFTKNIGKTIMIFKKEGIYPSVGLPWRKIILDNFTDPLLFNTAYSSNATNPIKSALTNLRYTDSIDQLNQINNLEKLYVRNAVPNTGYERYWHGYLVFLRPLLVFFSYTGIRILLTLMLYASLLYLSYLTWRILGKKLTIFFFFGLIAVDFFFLSKSLQFSSVFLIGFISSIFILKKPDKNHSALVLFFIVGGLTSFFDLLTAPLISLGIPLVIATALKKRRYVFSHCFAWTIGYLSLWLSKWILAALLYTPDAIRVSFNQIINRTITKADTQFTHFTAIKLNLFQLLGYHRISQLVVFVFILVLIFFLLRYFNFRKQTGKKILPWLFIATIPYLWYLVAANHSYLHCWYTYRNQFMSIVAGLMIFSEFINWHKVKQDLSFCCLRFRTVFRPAPKDHPD
jgi:hypothetical protein